MDNNPHDDGFYTPIPIDLNGSDFKCFEPDFDSINLRIRSIYVFKWV
jgi:hypothetical protein